MSTEEQFDFYWKEIFDGLPYNPIEFNVYRFDQSMSLPSKFNKLYDMFKQLALNNQEVMDYLKEFVETFDEKLYETLEDVLNVWLEDGRLADVVREAINEEVIEARTDYLGYTYLNLKERLDSEKVEFTTQLAQMAVNVKTVGVMGDGVTNDNLAIQTLLDNTDGYDTFYFPNGVYVIDEPLVIRNNQIKLILSPKATIKNTVNGKNSFKITGDYVSITGGKIISPPLFDATSITWQETDSIFYVVGNHFRATNVTLENVFKVGFGLRGSNNSTITECKINGNFPFSQWKSGMSSHFGIVIEDGINNNISNNRIARCIEGVFMAWRSLNIETVNNTINDNIISNCYDHAVYTGYGTSKNTIVSNICNNCLGSLAITGSKNIISNNVLNNEAGDFTEYGSCISLRNPENNIVSGNTINTLCNGTSTVIDFRVTSTDKINNNLVEGNIIENKGQPSQLILINNSSPTPETNFNVIKNNTLIGGVKATFGLITLIGDGDKTTNNTIDNNEFIVTGVDGTGHIVNSVNNHFTKVSDNNVVVYCNEAVTKNLRCFISDSTSNMAIEGNTLSCLPTMGTNINIMLCQGKNTPSQTDISNNKIKHNNALPTVIGVASYPFTDTILNNNQFGHDQKQGIATIASGTNSITVTNDNIVKEYNHVLVSPVNINAGLKSFYVSTNNGAFTIYIGGGENTPSDARYTWKIV